MTESRVHPNVSEKKWRNEVAKTMLNPNSRTELLGITSTQIFRSKTLITSMSDDIFNILSDALRFFGNWCEEVNKIENVSKNETQRMLPSSARLTFVAKDIMHFPRLVH